MKTYNCFQFYNELDILEIRLQECWDSTDYFVITESSHTHSGNSKDYVLLDNWERFKPYADKIRRIQIDETLEEQKKVFPNDSPEWIREKYQRYALVKGIHDLNPEDLIVLSDCDEVPRGDLIEMIKHDENDYDRYLINVAQFHFRLNYLRIKPEPKFVNIMAVRGRAFTNFMSEREFTFPWFKTPENSVYVEHGGWHWSDFGNDEHVVNKLKNFCHVDQNNQDQLNFINLDWIIANKRDRNPNDEGQRFEYVIMDDYFPKCITDNLDKWKHMIIPDAEYHVEDFYGVEEK
jgi:beta-1,4-mannosyl-glycoprotein beta-1,4-N-acetylglucosaminyltransferase